MERGDRNGGSLSRKLSRSVKRENELYREEGKKTKRQKEHQSITFLFYLQLPGVCVYMCLCACVRAGVRVCVGLHGSMRS